jgi:hypothetical protein
MQEGMSTQSERGGSARRNCTSKVWRGWHDDGEKLDPIRYRCDRYAWRVGDDYRARSGAELTGRRIINAKRKVRANVKLRREEDDPKQESDSAYALFPTRNLHNSDLSTLSKLVIAYPSPPFDAIMTSR